MKKYTPIDFSQRTLIFQNFLQRSPNLKVMSIITGKGFLLTYTETEVTCPICEQLFDCSSRSDKAPHPVFNMKCPKCKGKVTVSVPIMGGELKCWETECPKTVKRLETKTPSKVNGKVPIKKMCDDNSDEPSDIFV